MTRSSAAALLVALFSLRCGDEAEVVVFLDTSLGVPCEIDEMRVEVAGGGVGATRTVDPRDGLQSLTVIKDGGGDDFSLSVQGLLRSTVVARATAELSFDDGDRRALAVVLDERCLGQGCDLSGELGPFAEPAPAERRACEAVPLRYEFEQSAVRVADACTTTTGLVVEVAGFSPMAEVLEVTNELGDALQTRFDFRFYGERIQRLWISSDGYVAFGNAPPNAVIGETNLAGDRAPELAVAAFWDDLSLGNPESRVCVNLAGSGDREVLWITWKNLCFSPCVPGEALTFSVGLEEVTDRVNIGYLAMPDNDRGRGAVAAAGLRGPSAPGCSAEECDARGLCSDGLTPCGFTEVFSRVRPNQMPLAETTFNLRPIGGR